VDQGEDQGDRSLDYEFVIKGPVPLIPENNFIKEKRLT